MNSGQPCCYKGYLLMKYLESQDYILIGMREGKLTRFDPSLLGFRALKESMRKGDYVFSTASCIWYKAQVSNGLRTLVSIEHDQLPAKVKTICLLNDIPI